MSAPLPARAPGLVGVGAPAAPSGRLPARGAVLPGSVTSGPHAHQLGASTPPFLVFLRAPPELLYCRLFRGDFPSCSGKGGQPLRAAPAGARGRERRASLPLRRAQASGSDCQDQEPLLPWLSRSFGVAVLKEKLSRFGHLVKAEKRVFACVWLYGRGGFAFGALCEY